MSGPKTNEAPVRGGDELGTRAVLRHARMSPYKVREVLNLVRGLPVREAEDVLRFSERDAAFTVGKLLQSAVANAENNDELDPEELYVSACFADEGPTVKRWRPRARGRATRIRKRTSHITVIVSRLPDEDIERLHAHRRAEQLVQRARRVAAARRSDDSGNRASRRHPEQEEVVEDEDVAIDESVDTASSSIASGDENDDAVADTTVDDDSPVASPEADEPVAADAVEAEAADDEEEVAEAPAEQGDED